MEFFYEVEVLDGAAFFAPVVRGPLVAPFGEDVDPKFGIGVDFAAFGAGKFDGGDKSPSLHADIGGMIGAAEPDGLFGGGVDDGVAARSGIG